MVRAGVIDCSRVKNRCLFKYPPSPGRCAAIDCLWRVWWCRGEFLGSATRAGKCMCFESTHCSTGPQPCSACPDGIMAVRSSQPQTRCMAQFGWFRVLRGGSRAPSGSSRVRATEETRCGGGLRPRDEWTPSALPRYSELLTANMLTTLRLRVKRRCRRPGAPPGHDPATVARVRRRTRGVLVEFGLVCDGTGRGIVAW